MPGAGSQLGWLLWAGALDGAAAGAPPSGWCEPDVLTPYGLRTLSSAHPASAPQAYHRGGDLAVRLLARLGRAARRRAASTEAERVRAACSTRSTGSGCAPELYAVTAAGELESVPVANRVQAWTVGARWALEHGWDGRGQ